MKTINYRFFKIQGHRYLLGASTEGLSFVGSRDEDVTELNDFYPHTDLVATKTGLEEYRDQLAEYLSGQRSEFTIKTDISGTSFQESVWHELQKIPYGDTTNYTKIAEAIGHPKAVRAVGTAIGKNPLLMVIPCHRVLTKDNKLGGYRGGMAMKRDLLLLEEQNK